MRDILPTVRMRYEHWLLLFLSTEHKDVSERLKSENPSLYAQVKDILEINKQERHIRGGLATKRKYIEISERKKKQGR